MRAPPWCEKFVLDEPHVPVNKDTSCTGTVMSQAHKISRCGARNDAAPAALMSNDKITERIDSDTLIDLSDRLTSLHPSSLASPRWPVPGIIILNFDSAFTAEISPISLSDANYRI